VVCYNDRVIPDNVRWLSLLVFGLSTSICGNSAERSADSGQPSKWQMHYRVCRHTRHILRGKPGSAADFAKTTSPGLTGRRLAKSGQVSPEAHACAMLWCSSELRQACTKVLSLREVGKNSGSTFFG
jgi:hypothetical protein